MKVKAISIALCVVAIAAGCGSDDEGSSDSTDAAAVTTDAAGVTEPSSAPDQPATSEPPAGSVVDTAAVDEPSDTPIVIATFTAEDAATGANQPGIRQAMEAIIEDINTNGGINGQQVEFLYCNHQSDASLLTQCAEEAVAADATAVVSPYANLPAHYPILSAAGIPILDAVATNPGGLDDPNNYIVAAGGQGLSVGMAAGAIDQLGYSNIGVVASEIPATVPVTEAFIAAVEEHGGTVATQVNVPASMTDLAAVVAEAENANADGMYLLLPPAQVLSYMQAAKQAGADTPLITGAALLFQSHIDQTGGAESPAEGAMIGDLFPSGASPIWDDFKGVVESYDGDTEAVDFFNSGVQGAWVTMQIFQQVAALIDGDVTRESFTAALAEADAIETGGLTPTLDFSQPWDVPGYGSMYNRTINFATVTDGKFAPSDLEPVDGSDDFRTLFGS